MTERNDVSRAQRGPRATACVMIAFLLTAATAVQPAVAAPSTKYYSATPAAVYASTTSPAVVDLSNCKPCVDPSTGKSLTSTQSFGSVEVRFAGTSLTAVGASVTAPVGAWTVTSRTEGSDTVLRLTNPGPGTTFAATPGRAVRLSIPVAAGTTSAIVPLRTQVKQSNDFSGAGNDVTRVGPDPVVYIGGGPPDHLEIVRGASTVQVSPSSDPAAALTMCPAPVVRVLDAGGNVVTGLPPTAVTLSTDGASAALHVNGDGKTAAGVVTFGSAPDADGACLPAAGDNSVSAGNLGRGFRLIATLAGGAVPSVTDTGTFDVLPFYVRCPLQCSANSSSSGTTAAVSAVLPSTATGPAVGAALTFGVGVDTYGPSFVGACNPDVGGTVGELNPYRSPVTVDLADHDKTVQLRWSKKAVQWATNNGSSQWGVCMAAAYSFTTADTTQAPLVDGWYVGLLPRCGAVALGSPCIARLTRQAGEQLATVSIPDREGDPRMI